MSETSCDGGEQFLRGIEVLGTAKSNDTCETYFRRESRGDVHAKVGNNNIRRWDLGTEQQVLWSDHKP